MPRLERPLDKEAVQEADEQIYALHAGDPRPNALYDANGNRLKLDATDPAQAGLRSEWCDLYRAALAKKKKEPPPDEGKPPEPKPPAPPPPAPPSDDPVGEVTKPCPKKFWIKTHLIRLPDQKARPDWWPSDAGGPYPYEPYTAEITDGHKESALDSDGFAGYENIPAGSCSWKFTTFFDLVETALKPGAPVKDAESLVTAAKPKPKSYKVDLVVQKATLTLKHDNKSKLEVKVIPADAAVSEYRIELKRVSGGAWFPIGSAEVLDPWTAKIAGKFKIRGVAKIDGKEVVSSEKDMEVQFPAYSEIVGDADVQTAVSTAWTNTLNDCTSAPNQRREHG